ncbi:RNA polymerase sigma-70 factor, ECF subfamily [Filimonas lacunae]|uniref:RNA polymerase sigma-70 factor, ECF subfamily n=1 Tax=Filimonas lacunae TaxID=477680 RepID=A0A173MCC3_9BACT|nr:sigma-70 family RNA polymerase sigma factor [Filimonas lacunae]BAV05224.1 RNA polymerase ECF-type sigma factor [Filimonas lacunae]SIT22537.1 RNA polymerase sigma-70 factor, ECF subfamily [Filimonas lacunae]
MAAIFAVEPGRGPLSITYPTRFSTDEPNHQMNRENTDHISDQELLERFYSTRNNQWLGILLQRYTMLLLGVCMKYLKNEEEARDSVQQIFLKAITELQKYQVTYIKSWLYMIAKNHCLMKLRDKTGKATKEITETMPLSAPENALTELAEKEEVLNLVEASMNELNEEQKTCVTLFYLQKNSYNEVSEKTGFSLLQVKSFIQNGKRNLRLLVEQKLKKKS